MRYDARVATPPSAGVSTLRQGTELSASKTKPIKATDGIRLDLEERSFYLFSIMATQINRAVTRAYVQRYGRPANTWRILAVLNKYKSQSPSDLEHHTTLEKDKITRIVDELVASGLAVRKPDKTDRRRVVIALSASGRRRTRHLESIIATMEREFLSALGAAERQSFYELLEKLKSRADEIFAK